ncbi:MAG TPA: M3 family metallopeptidase [Bacteroidales bacterium]|nr:M3 family metallopeptidase [Bacteroidales bacterium]
MNKSETKNPLLQEWNTPFGAPPFDQIKPGHFRPAAEEAIKEALAEIDLIAGNGETPDFFNTVESLEYCGEKVGRVASVLYNLNSAETSPELQAAARDISPLLARFSNDITLNQKLFERIKKVYDSREKESLSPEQRTLLDRKYKSFVLGGAALDEEKKKRFREISEELSTAGLKFEENVLEETNAYELHLTDINDLEGLPVLVKEAAMHEAETRKKDGWVFTLHFPSYIPFMQYSARRDLREKMFRAYTSRAYHGNERDNRDLVIRIVNLRLEIASLLGYETYADLALVDRMADTRQKVSSFLEELYSSSHPAARRDYDNILNYAKLNGHTGQVERWDWAYFSEKLKKSKFDIDDEVLRPYFSLEQVINAVFSLAGKLYGLSFVPDTKIPLYHPEVRTWQVIGTDGNFKALFYADFHPRQGKSGGAWMTCYREQRKEHGKDIRPLVSIVTNFGRPTSASPSLLTFTELTTFLHEFGHSLHAILSDCTYESVSGTNVARDFVELPSQFMENFAFEREWLESWAIHYRTGERIPYEIVKRIQEASTFNEGYACERQLGFAFLDMAWHSMSSPYPGRVEDIEGEVLKRTDMFPAVGSANVSCSFTHLFGGGYASGYYGYKWAEVLDADAFWYFREKGIFNSEVAASFRKNILEKGGTEKPMDLYKRFRGREPSIEALLQRSGLK